MDGLQNQFSKLSSKRISALFSTQTSSDSNANANVNDYSTKNRSRELKRLSKTMDVDVAKVKELLKKQAMKSDTTTPDAKQQYVQWLLGKDSNKENNNAAAAASEKRKRSDSNGTTKPTKKTASADLNGEDNGPSNNKNNKSKTIRPKKPTPRANGDDTSNNNNNVINGQEQNSNLHSSMKFRDMNLNPKTEKAISQILKHEFMTEIQSRTHIAAAAGTDVLGRARTGTGKTLAFLTPALERILQSNDFRAGKNIGVLVVSPTRELATQIADQAEKLLTFHNGLTCQVMFGGTKMTADTNRLNRQLPAILVATPGRLMDHLENTRLSNGKKFGNDIMRECSVLILDEADRLLDMGFQREIQKIMKFLPRQEKRQTLLFSATVPPELKKIMSQSMREDFVEVDCIGGDGTSEFVNEEHTNTLVEQTHVILPSLDRYVTSVVEIVKHNMKEKDHKLVVFFPTARLVGYFAEFFNLGLGIEVIELHSRKTQGYRNTASDKFRKAKSGILFTSDVSARGVDYPNVSGVIQIGIPESRDQYIHRLGRTGRAGKEGKGVIVLAPFEAKFINELKDIDIPVNNELSEILQNPVDEKIMSDLNVVFNRIRSGDQKLTQSAQQAYQAFIGYYKGQMKRMSVRNAEQLVDIANEYSRHMGLKEIPGIPKRTAGKMGIAKLPNVRIINDSGGRGGGGRGGGRGGGGRGGGGRRR